MKKRILSLIMSILLVTLYMPVNAISLTFEELNDTEDINKQNIISPLATETIKEIEVNNIALMNDRAIKGSGYSESGMNLSLPDGRGEKLCNFYSYALCGDSTASTATMQSGKVVETSGDISFYMCVRACNEVVVRLFMYVDVIDSTTGSVVVTRNILSDVGYGSGYFEASTSTDKSPAPRYVSWKSPYNNTNYRYRVRMEVTQKRIHDQGQLIGAWVYDLRYSGVPVKDAPVDYKAEYIVNHYLMNIDGTTYTLKDSKTFSDNIGTNVTPKTNIYTGFTSPAVQSKTIVSGTNIINYYYTRNKYTVTYIDKTSDGKELGRTTKQMFYDANVRGSELGSNSSDNVYYLQHKYISDTTATVTTEGATVYRIFEFCETEAISNLKWNDSNNKDGFRPSKYKLKLKQNGVKINEVELSSETLHYSFTNLPKYDTAGRQYQYTFDVDATERYNISFDDNGNLIVENYQPASFSVVIPKQIVLNGNTGRANYTVSIDGVFYYNDNLTVKPNSSFVLRDKNNISHMTGTVNQPKTNFIKSDLNNIYNGTISVNRTNFSGLWNGSFNFEIKFEKKN